MKNRIQRNAKRWLWVFSVAVFFMAEANALVLGNIQVDSAVGQPLIARISIEELTNADVQQFKARLADDQEYKKLGLQYPYGFKFHFRLVQESGGTPFISVTTDQSLGDPLNDLVVEVSSGSGRQIRSYTFLLDPT